jgi:hypothetical protein
MKTPPDAVRAVPIRCNLARAMKRDVMAKLTPPVTRIRKYVPAMEGR